MCSRCSGFSLTELRQSLTDSAVVVVVVGNLSSSFWGSKVAKVVSAYKADLFLWVCN